MKYRITQNSRTKDIKDAFIKHFPFLKLEFVKGEHHDITGRPVPEFVFGNDRLSLASDAFKEGELVIKPATAIKELESDFKKKFGLLIRVYRKQKDSWVDTGNTKEYSLEKQNAIGRQSCGIFLKSMTTVKNIIN